ncbi:peptidoglycan DD-metalloendopeptidase family protein [uncultured Roseovarius sp.]|uniref:murein hydrolase activator EnvC family protein n=1 Tax=uncultured Roseovarius sp. TaxID=293344 RepID=UPI0025EB8EFF|nr:peptidoglycan DD-metalloendopeptidase family protein [uncultured Roseovarius sp.]
MKPLAAFAGILMAGAVAAQEPAATPDPAANARAAAERLSRAGQMLDDAQSARNRVKALSETVRAYEDGLEAMREGLRRAAIREETLTRDLQSREDDIARLLGVLMAMGETPAPVLLLHPSGPVGTARSGMIVAEVTPALNARATDLRERLNEVAILRSLQETAADTLANGLQGAQKARTALSQAIADRTDLPRRFTEDPVKTALLIASTETLEGFASGLSEIAVDEAPGSLPGIADRKGELPLPVEGRILRRAGEQDAAGIARPGIVMATRPRALVTTPAPATVRYRGPLLDYGNVIILEPQAGILLVLAGLDVVYGDTGQVLPGGSPVGLMGGTTPAADLVSSGSAQETDAERSETLYIEVREDNSPVDPAQWFQTDEG